jgi:TRAP-type transport system periplasmic protein
MKNIRFIAAFALFSMVFFASSSYAQKKTVLKWGDVLTTSHPSVQMIDRIAKEVEKESKGSVVIQSYPGGQLGGSRDMIEAVSNNMLELTTEGAANIGQFVSAIGILEAPYVWRDANHLTKTIKGKIGEDLSKQLVEKKNMRILGATYYGVRHVTTSEKKIQSLKDFQGFKIRVPENEVYKAMAEAWGAKPTPMNFNELYLALKTNVVDGEENPLPTIDSAKFYEVQKYIILTGHIITPRLVLLSEKTWQSLTKKDQAILMKAVDNGIKWNNEQILKAEADLIKKFEGAGVTIIKPNVAEIRDAVLKQVPKKFAQKWGEGMWEKIQAVK